uniref:Alpha-1-antiproteinase 4 (Fragments) n=1 Tax=Equus caballus TaxID=9796 RepID=A1AT4_HORSE|nr:RecName: Full=Alpha-1-antiproteinase 4; AltName: Full=Alpha-1-antitrypsin 4; AltName: Full=Alpha-1-proteinase inhibitor 4; AltName: Full=SPI4 [Equus caballus]
EDLQGTAVQERSAKASDEEEAIRTLLLTNVEFNRPFVLSIYDR